MHCVCHRMYTLFFFYDNDLAEKKAGLDLGNSGNLFILCLKCVNLYSAER